jgi:sporulation protein YlmC with PRC-barrel domain
MLKQISSTAAILILAGGIACAQSSITRTTSPLLSSTTSLSTDQWLMSDIYKANVYDNANHTIGDVKDLILDQNGNITKAVIGVGGFLGIGQKDVAIPFKDLKVESQDGKEHFVLGWTRDQPKDAPSYDKKDPKRM